MVTGEIREHLGHLASQHRVITIYGLLAAVAALPTLAGCEAMLSAPAPIGTSAAMSDAAGHAMVRTELLFGLTRDDGTGVDEMEWQEFVDKAVAAWFPAGFTVIDTYGRWRGADGNALSERSKVLVIFHDGSEANLRKLDELRRLYCQRFGQQPVIRASSNAWVAF